MASVDEILNAANNPVGVQQQTDGSLSSSQMNYLNNVQPKGQDNALTVEDFKPIIPDALTPEEQNMFNQQNFYEQNPAMSPLPVSEYYPGIDQPIARGSYSGPHIGSLTLFAPGGGFVPYGVVDAREQAIQRAADHKAAQINNFYSKFKSPVTKHSVVQNQIDEGFYNQLQSEIIPYLQKKYGQNWHAAASNDLHVQNWVRNWNTLKDQEDFMTNRVATLEKEIQSGDFVATPELSQKLKEFYTDAKGLTEGAVNPTGKRFSDTVLGFNNEYELNKVLNNSVKELANLPEVKQSYPGISDKGDFSLITSAVRESFSDDRLREVAKNIKNQHYSDSKNITEDKIFNGLRAIVGTGKKTYKIDTVSKPKASGADIEHKVEDINNETEDINGRQLLQKKYWKDGNPTSRDVSFETKDGLTLKEKVPVTIPVGAKFVDLDQGNTFDKNVKNVNGVIGKVYNAYVLDDPKHPLSESFVPKDALKDEINSGRVKMKPFASVIYTDEQEVDDQIVKTQKSVQVPLENVENALEGRQGQNKKVLQEIKNRAETQSQQLKKKVVSSQSHSAGTGKKKSAADYGL